MRVETGHAPSLRNKAKPVHYPILLDHLNQLVLGKFILPAIKIFLGNPGFMTML